MLQFLSQFLCLLFACSWAGAAAHAGFSKSDCALYLLGEAKRVNPTVDAAVEAFEPSRLEEQLVAFVRSALESQAIAAYAKNHGFRAWLFGGAATGAAHRWRTDLVERLAGRSSALPRKLTYLDLYRASQDIDIVIDGESGDAYGLQNMLETLFPYKRGKKSAWEVRLLKNDWNFRIALLDNKDFLLMHNDSGSVGFIELTSHRGSHPVRDLRAWRQDWEKDLPKFFEDVIRKKITFHFSPGHESTSRYARGANPPILSVIRYLTKVFQYGLRMDQADIEAIVKITRQTDMKRDFSNPSSEYPLKWLSWAGKKLFQSAKNLEYAAQVLDSLGLRASLIKLGNAEKKDSFAWWLAREPLRSHELGKLVENDPRHRMAGALQPGKTAAELGIERVTHSIPLKRYTEYELLEWADAPEANVFTSIYGADRARGFLARAADQTPSPTDPADFHMEAKFDVHPDAREGVDFVIRHEGILFLNKRALRTVRESLTWDIDAYYDFLATDPNLDAFEPSYLDRVRKHIHDKFMVLGSEDKQALVSAMEKHIDHGSVGVSNHLFATIIRSPAGWTEIPAFFDCLKTLLKRKNGIDLGLLRQFTKHALSQAEWARHPEGWEITRLLAMKRSPQVGRALVKHVLGKEYWTDGRTEEQIADLIELIKSNGDARTALMLKELRKQP